MSSPSLPEYSALGLASTVTSIRPSLSSILFSLLWVWWVCVCVAGCGGYVFGWFGVVGFRVAGFVLWLSWGGDAGLLVPLLVGVSHWWSWWWWCRECLKKFHTCDGGGSNDNGSVSGCGLKRGRRRDSKEQRKNK